MSPPSTTECSIKPPFCVPPVVLLLFTLQEGSYSLCSCWAFIFPVQHFVLRLICIVVRVAYSLFMLCCIPLWEYAHFIFHSHIQLDYLHFEAIINVSLINIFNVNGHN